ncbi:MAG: glycosyltransferase family 4 protein [Saprospiraceae bacterium]|nr:glycosyltransferase family 4 protein [Saprospiraceae bacterium]
MTNGYEVTIFTFSLQYPKLLFPGKTQYASDPAPDGLNIKIRINSINPFNWWRVGKELKELKPDWIISVFWLPFMAASLGTILRIAKKNKHSKVVGLIHNIIPHEKRFGDEWLARYFAKVPDCFVTLSAAVAKEVQYFAPQKPVQYAPHPIYDHYGELLPKVQAKSMLELDVSKNYILFFGFIRAYKGLDLLLDAMSDQRIKLLNIQLIVAGEYYEEESAYQQKIRQLGIDPQLVLHTFYIPSNKVNQYFSAADLVVQPYRSATQSGISQIAYHFDKPMIVTNVGGLPEIVENGVAGYVVEPTPLAIADALVDFYENQKMSNLEEGVRRNKHLFTWQYLIKTIESVTKS